MEMNILETRAGRFFWKVTAWPKTILVLALLLVVGTAAFLPHLTKDTRSDAFIPADDPSLVYRDKVKEIFGLADPMVIAVINEGPDGVFNPHSLQLVSCRAADLVVVDVQNSAVGQLFEMRQRLVSQGAASEIEHITSRQPAQFSQALRMRQRTAIQAEIIQVW